MKRGAALGLALLAGCSGAETPDKPSWQSGSSGVRDASSGTSGEKLFPMVDGHIYHYRTQSFGAGPAVESGVLMIKMHRASPTVGEMRRPSGPQRFEYTPAGVATKTKGGAPAYLIKLPADPSTTWLGPQGGQTRVEASGVTATTQAGTFSDCVTTMEERGGDAPLRVKTTLCPGVGIVSMEVQSGAAVEKAELVYFGPPVDIGGEGLKRVE